VRSAEQFSSARPRNGTMESSTQRPCVRICIAASILSDINQRTCSTTPAGVCSGLTFRKWARPNLEAGDGIEIRAPHSGLRLPDAAGLSNSTPDSSDWGKRGGNGRPGGIGMGQRS
jgi:hypothetical protein